MSAVEFHDGEVVIDGVAGKDIVAALRGTGLSEDAVVALMGRLIAQSAAAGSTAEPAEPAEPAEAALAGEGEAAAAAAPFTFQTKISQSAPECAATYTRTFVHPDFVDGLTVVQAGTTPEELGFNARFHGIEVEFDEIAVNFYRLSNCLAELRSEVYGMARELEDKITEIDAELHAKGKEKEGKDTKEKDKEKDKEKEGKDKEKEKEKEGKDKEKEDKEGKEDRDKLAPIEKAIPVENIAAPGAEEQPAPDDATARTFVRPVDRPPVGERALEEPDGGDG